MGLFFFVRAKWPYFLYVLSFLFIYGCASQGPKLSKKDKMDDDKDGIINAYDKCTNTPLEVIVDAFGCPVDTDEDGVPDFKDKEPNSRVGVEVDEDGVEFVYVEPEIINNDIDNETALIDSSEISQMDSLASSTSMIVDEPPVPIIDPAVELQILLENFGLPTLYYGLNKANLSQINKFQLDAIIPVLNLHPGIKINLEGYTDRSGPSDFNLKLSEKRAKEAVDYLVSKNQIKSNQLEYTFYGEDKPASGSESQRPNSLDRRTEIQFKISVSQEMLASVDVEEYLKYKDPAIELQQILDIYGVTQLYYGIGQSRLTTIHRNSLNKITPVLTVHPRLKVMVQGYTDKSGPEDFNLRLSEKRAKLAANYMKSKQMATDKQINYEFFGESNPASGSTSETPMAKDRRTEIHFKVIDN